MLGIQINKPVSDLEKEIKAIDFDLEVDYEKTISHGFRCPIPT